MKFDLAGVLVDRIAEEFRKAPPTIALIGVSGVGKSSTINAMFKTQLTVSPTVRGTTRWSSHRFSLEGRKVLNRDLASALVVYDAVGLGEDIRLDANYLSRYREHLPKCDVAIWISTARNRAVALDQTYMQEVSEQLGPVVIGLNQVDLIEPLDWSEGYNIPSKTQAAHLASIVADRTEKYAAVLKRSVPIVPYSARRFYNLSTLFKEVMLQAPPHRRWMFQMLKGFSAQDWLDQATGLSDDQKTALAARQDKKDPDGFMSLLRSRLGLSA